MRCSLTSLALLLLAAPAVAQDWPNWRGPSHDGSSAIEALPESFDKETNVRWSAPLPGPGASTPVVVGERIFLTAVDHDAGALIGLCIERDTGELVWMKDLDSGFEPTGGHGGVYLHDRSNYASPSAVANEEHVWFFFGNGDLICCDHAGEEVWSQNLQREHGEFAFQWTFSASPTLWEGRLFLPILQRNVPVNDRGAEGAESFLLALDASDGAQVFKHVRPSQARVESLESYATMIPYVGESGRKELLVVGGDVVTGHDPASGAELWRWGTWNQGHSEIWWRVVPSAVAGGGVVLACAPKRAPVYAVHLDGEGELGDAGLAWRSEGRPNKVSSDVPTPLYYQGKFFVLSDVRSALSRVDPTSGEVEWSTTMPGRDQWRASPTGADGRIWCMNHAGLVVAVDAQSGEIVLEASMGGEDDETTRASIAAAHGALFVRTHDTLWCVAAGERAGE